MSDTTTTLFDASALRAAADKLTAPGSRLEIVTRPDGLRTFTRGPTTVLDLLETVAAAGEDDFLVQGEIRLTYPQFARLTWGSAARLGDLGFGRHDRLALMARNSPGWVVAAFAAAAAGGMVAPFNYSWSVEETIHALVLCRPRILVIDAGCARMLDPILDTVAAYGVEQVFVLGNRPGAGLREFGDIVAAADDRPNVTIDPSDPFALIFTSGTTGQAKACVTTHEGTIAQINTMIFSAVLGRDRTATPTAPSTQHALLATSPLFHVSGLHSAVCSSIATRSKVVLLEGRFEPEDVLKIIERERITAWGGVPTMVHRLLSSSSFDAFDTSTLASVAIGGAPLTNATLRLAQAKIGDRLRLGHGYGMTETHGSITMNAGRGLAALPGSVGMPSPLVDLRIADAAGVELPEGEVGEILVRGIIVTPGYWDDADATDRAITDGWLHTGDVGYVDADGYLYLVDRLKDIVIRGGENIASVEVESSIAEQEGVDECAVFGIPDDDLGERLAAVVVSMDARVTPETIRTQLAGRIARFKIPDVIWLRTEPLPKNEVGKVLKPELRLAQLTEDGDRK
jgi:long-chain acyl-CoA synthetase